MNGITTTPYNLNNYITGDYTLNRLPGDSRNAETQDPFSSEPATRSAEPASVSRKASSGARGHEKSPESKPSGAKNSTGSELSEKEEQRVEKLKKQDRKIRRHEQAHLAAAGPYAKGGARYTYKTGPDGKQYAVDGSVSIDTGTESSPEATIAKMKVVQRAALAPQDPSPQDRATYSAAVKKEMKARQAMRQQSQEEAREAGEAQGRASETKPAGIGNGRRISTASAGSHTAPEIARGSYVRQGIPEPSTGGTGTTKLDMTA